MAVGNQRGDDEVSRLVGAVGRIVDWLPVALVVVAEASWISVVDGLVAEFALRQPSLSIPALAGFVVAGILAARLLGPRLGAGWPPAALALILAAGVLGELASPAAQAALAGGPGAVLTANPDGWIAGLAALRGFAHARLPLAEGTVARLLALGVPFVAALAVLGGVIVEPFRTRFLADTLTAAVVFIGTGILALTLVRVAAVGEDAGFGWRRNPSWLGLTLAVLAVAVLAALPLAAVAGWAIEVLIAVSLGPLLVIGLTMGLDRTARRVVGFVLAAGAVTYLVLMVFQGTGGLPAAPPGPPTAADRPTVADQILTAGLGGLVIVVAVVAILILAAIWMRRAAVPEDEPVTETRTIDRGTDAPAPRRGRRRGWRRVEPTDAAAAYVALVDDLARYPVIRRAGWETPAEHAARLRAAGRSDLRLDLLAADYALARFGGVDLPGREHRRAIGRWRRLRRTLRPGDAGS